MAYQEGDTSPPHINVHNEVVTQVQDLADARNVDVILPPQRNIGDTEHVKDHNLITDALAAVAAAGGGKVLQVVRATEKTSFTTTSTSFDPVPGMSVSITPTSSLSTILVLCAFRANIESSTTTAMRAEAALFDRDGNKLDGAQSSCFGMERFDRTGGTTIIQHTVSMWAHVSPATTSERTYDMRIAVTNSGSAVTVRNANQTGQLYAIELADVVVSP